MRCIPFSASATAALCGLALVYLSTVDASGRESDPETWIDVHSDGVSVIFTAHSTDELLSLTVRVADPEGRIVFDRRAEAPMVEWVPDSDLTDGRYTWEARSVTIVPGAPQGPSSGPAWPEGDAMGRTGVKADSASPTVPIERLYSDRHKQVTRAHGHLLSRLGLLETLPSGHEAASSGERMLGAVLRWLVPPAYSDQVFNEDVVIQESTPDLDFVDPDGGNDWRIRGEESRFLIYQPGITIPMEIEAGAPGESLYVSSGGRIGLGTSTPGTRLHLSHWFPTIGFEDTDGGGYTWRLIGESRFFQIEDASSGETPIYIHPGAPTNSFRIANDGDTYMGAGNKFLVEPEASVHVERWNGTASMLIEENTDTTGARELFKLKNNGAPFFIFENTDVAQSYSFAMGATGHFLISHQQTSGIQMRLRPNGDMTIAGTLTEGSSRALKDGMVTVDPGAVLAKVDTLPIREWHYTGNESNRHMGPIAEDFYATFGLGPDNRHIAPKDLAGVSLAAIKALKGENEALRAETKALKAQSERLRASLKSRLTRRDQRIANLEEKVETMEQSIRRVSGSDVGSIESVEHSPR